MREIRVKVGACTLLQDCLRGFTVKNYLGEA